MPFTADILEPTLQTAIHRIASRAHLFNRIAHTSINPVSRRTAYRAKVSCVSRLLTMRGGAQVEEVLPGRGLVTVALPTGRRLHVPLEHLEPAAKQVVARILRECVAAACSYSEDTQSV